MVETIQATAGAAIPPTMAEPQANPSGDTAAATGFMRREAILTASSGLYGYELFYRESTPDAGEADAENATQRVIDNYLMMLPPLDQGKGFVPCTRKTLETGLVTLLPRRNTVLEILRSVDPDPALVAKCRELHRTGYRFALEGLSSDRIMTPYLDLVDYVKIDFKASDAEERRQIRAIAERSRVQNKLLATNIESAEDFDLARKEGCQLFKGPHFARPAAVTQQVLPSNQVVCLRLMAALSEQSADTSKIESLVMMDASLCFRLLRLVNSALYSLNSQVTSIRGALVVVGTDEFRKLVKVSLAGALAAAQSKSLVAMALERARFCELLAPKIGEPGPTLYLLGMMSLMDAILKISMMKILEMLPLDPDMKAALLGGQSTIGLALELIRSYQAGDWEACERSRQRLGLAEADVPATYMQAVNWANEAMRP